MAAYLWAVEVPTPGEFPEGGLFYLGHLVATGDEARIERVATRLNDKERVRELGAWTLDIDSDGVCWIVDPKGIRWAYGDAAELARWCIGLNRYHGSSPF